MSNRYVCDDCGLEGDGDDLPLAKDLHQRLTPGYLYTDVECPECGALCFPKEAGAKAGLLQCLKACATPQVPAAPEDRTLRLLAINALINTELRRHGVDP